MFNLLKFNLYVVQFENIGNEKYVLIYEFLVANDFLLNFEMSWER